MKAERPPEVYLRLVFPDHHAVGPYGAAFLDAVRRGNSIAAAARLMRSTYRRAWLTTRNLNAMFAVPLIATKPGRSGGAALTDAGEKVLELFRDAERRTQEALQSHVRTLHALRTGRRPPG